MAYLSRWPNLAFLAKLTAKRQKRRPPKAAFSIVDVTKSA
jgi:hypothetical protein